jgi:hypothetical protein
LEGGSVQRLSIIVPLMGDLQRLEDTLVSVLENQPERSAVIVVLNEPYADPYDLQSEVTFVEAPQGADLVDCFACGLAASRAPIVHMIAAGLEATPGWTDPALARFAEADVAAVAPVVVDRDNPDRILSAGLRWTAAGSTSRIAAGKRLHRFVANDRRLCGPELAVSFYRREVLQTIGTLQHHGSELAAATEVGMALRKAGYRSVQEPACVTTAGGELLAGHHAPVVGSAWREGLAGEWLFRRWSAVPGWKRSWAAHAALVAMECLQLPLRPLILARLAGRLWAALGFASPRMVTIGPHVAASSGGAVIRPAHFSTADSRPALQSRAAG